MVAVVGVVEVAISRPAILRGIRPTTAADYPMRTLGICPFILIDQQFSSTSLIAYLFLTLIRNALASACSVNAVKADICF